MDETTPNPSSIAPYKKRRTQGACDICKQKKGDSATMPGNRCSNCIAFGSECTHLAAKASKRRNLQNMQHFDEQAGDDNVESTQGLVSAILSSSGVTALPTDPLVVRNTLRRIAVYARSLETEVAKLRRLQAESSRENSVPSEASQIPEDEGSELPFAEDLIDVTRELKWLTLNTSNNRAFGQSSGIMLVKDAMNAKTDSGIETSDENFLQGRKRPEFWRISPWEAEVPHSTKRLEFPPPDLMQNLVQLYFKCVHPHMPFLHRGSIERSIAEGMHVRDRHFGSLILAMCALGSRYTDDPRVYLEGANSHSAGWKFYCQVDLVQSSNSPHLTSLYQLQTLCIGIIYRYGTSSSEGAWMLIAMGTRYCHEIGVHRRRRGQKHTIEDELWKRAYWILVCMDALVCSYLGRPRCTHPDDYDLDLPVNCDDEYWEHPDPQLAWKQPAGKLSMSYAFIALVQLVEILGVAQRSIYSVRRAGLLSDQTPPRGWDQRIVVQLDSALNSWLDSLPDYLRWDPHGDLQPFFDQSVSLYSSYYHVQMQIHRPFIPAPGKQSPVSFPSLAICANAARSCCHVIEVHSKKGYLPLPHVQSALFTSGVTLLLNVWGGKHSGSSVNLQKEMADVQKCVNMLRKYEPWWYQAGQFCDILYELSSIGELPLQERTPPSMKRPREEDAHSTPESFDDFTLPTYSAELGQLPIDAPLSSFDKSLTGVSDPFTSTLISPETPAEFAGLMSDFQGYYTPPSSSYLSPATLSPPASSPNAGLFGAPGDTLNNWMNANATNVNPHSWSTWQAYLNVVNGPTHYPGRDGTGTTRRSEQ
ncbi:hypothetical protein AX16_005231 [Volvariella volvacea WC 439]|nr:hypothetical protein AX16_005231 [Volvariella volvacea WC 439]